MAKLSQIADSLLENEEGKHTVQLFGQELPFKISNYGIRRLRDEGQQREGEKIDPIRSFFRLLQDLQEASVDRQEIEAELEALKVSQLRQRAEQHGLDLPSNARKDELIDAIANVEAQMYEVGTDQYLDVMGISYAGVVTYDRDLKLETFERLFEFQHMGDVLPVIMQEMTGMTTDIQDSDVEVLAEDGADEEGKG